MRKDEVQASIERYIDAYNNFDIDRMTAELHSAIVFRNISDGEINLTTNGIEEFRAQAEKAAAFFNERKQTIAGLEIDDQKAEVSIKYVAILATDLPNGMKAGDKLDMEGRSNFLFKEGLIVSLDDVS